MSEFREKFNAGESRSAEQSMTLDFSDIELAGAFLNHDPVAFLREIRADFLKKRDTEAVDFDDALVNPIVEALAGLDEATKYLKDNQVSINNPYLIKFIQEKSDREKHNSSDEGEMFFKMLKWAGYTNEEVGTWIGFEGDFVSEEVTEERRMIWNQIYGTE